MKGSLETLKFGEVLLTEVRPVNYTDPSKPKVQIEIAEFVRDPQRSVSALSLFNADDDRFSGKPRRAWLVVSPAMLKTHLGVDLPVGFADGDEVIELNILNPMVGNQPLRIQIEETLTPSEWQSLNIDKAAKRAGKDGPYITHGGNYIFSNTTVVIGEPKHAFLEGDRPEIKGIPAGTVSIGALNS
jgi:hypothetical protein